MTAKTHLFHCLKDNFGVLIHDPATGATAAIDAPEAGPVEAALQETGWKLTDILVTHHHGDHTGGIADLKKRHKCRVVAPRNEAARIPLVDETVGEGDTVKVGDLTARVIETPGHTAGHITYWFEADDLAFAGDTLFSIGCGRVIEGTPEMMWDSLLKLRNLPPATRVYCGHEYTLANIHFAADHRAGQHGADRARRRGGRAGARHKPTIPTTIGAETRRQSVPARRRAGGRRRGRHGGPARGASVRGDPRAKEQVLRAGGRDSDERAGQRRIGTLRSRARPRSST